MTKELLPAWLISFGFPWDYVNVSRASSSTSHLFSNTQATWFGKNIALYKKYPGENRHVIVFTLLVWVCISRHQSTDCWECNTWHSSYSSCCPHHPENNAQCNATTKWGGEGTSQKHKPDPPALISSSLLKSTFCHLWLGTLYMPENAGNWKYFFSLAFRTHCFSPCFFDWRKYWRGTLDLLQAF